MADARGDTTAMADQASKDAENTAPMIRAFYKELRASGMPDSTAHLLVAKYADRVMARGAG
jgi:hypothetical protein